MFRALDGPSKQIKLSVLDNAITEVKVDAQPLSGRSVITILPVEGKIFIYFGDGENTPDVNTIINNGFPHPKNSMKSYEAGPKQPVFIISETGTINVIIAERS